MLSPLMGAPWPVCLSIWCLCRMLTSCAAGFRCPPLSPSKVQLDRGGGGVGQVPSEDGVGQMPSEDGGGQMPSAASSLGQRPWPLLEEEGICFLWIVLVPSQRPLEKNTWKPEESLEGDSLGYA